MSNGKKKRQLPSQNSEEKKYPEPRPGLVEEYEWMKKLALKAEKDRGQTDTSWHTAWARTRAALQDEFGMEVD
jgi:hypothetical protein